MYRLEDVGSQGGWSVLEGLCISGRMARGYRRPVRLGVPHRGCV
jgi:hypothetical protein